MNILILQTKAFPHRSNSFCWFYLQLTEWLTRHGVPSKLFYCYLEVDDGEFENGLLLPDRYAQFYTPRNVEVTLRYIEENDIRLILDYSHVITGDTKRYFQEIKRRNPALKVFTMIHNCPSHTTQLQAYKVSLLRLKEVHGPKQLFQWMFPRLYIQLLKRVVRAQNQSAYHALDEVVLLSPSYIPEFKQLIKEADADRLSAIPNAIRPVQSRIPIGEKRKEIVFVGRMEPEKALPKLIKIWEMVEEKLPDWQLTLVGDGSRFQEVQALVKHKGLKRVHLAGHQMAIPYIDRASIICLTSVIEGLPTVFVEAMSLGVVPIGFASFNAIYDMIEDGKNGVIIPDNHYREYAEALIELATNDRMRQRMAIEALSGKGKYDIEQVGPLWMEAFKKHGLVK